MKTKTCLLRLTDYEYSLFSAKSKVLGTDKSKLFRNGAIQYWNGHSIPDADSLLKLYQNGTTEDKSLIVNLLFEYYRLAGYPHRTLSAEELRQSMGTLAVTKDPLLENDHLQSNTTGISIANHFHPHMVKVKCLKNYRSPYEQFIDDDLLKDAINRWMELGKRPNSSGLRRILRTRDGVRSVVNFKPAIGRHIYKNYCPQNGSCLDPCAGYGGRLAGLISTGSNLFYHGVDPSPETVVGNTRLSAFFAGQYEKIEEKLVWPFRFRHDLGCAEDIMPSLPDESYDLVFTSPPYWSVEKYDNLPTQSYLRYPEYEQWKDGFLTPLIVQSQRVCRKGGYVIINIKNYKKHKLADDAMMLANACGLMLEKTLQMRLSNSEYNRKEGEKMWHIEPILVFKKR